MCGLVGFISNQQQDSVLQSMLEVLTYRGPDDSGTLIETVDRSFIHLGQNRLAIQDTSQKGHQPFVSDCGNYILVFNGEVYNFKAIRVELEALGQAFISGSDTEVILYAFKYWGIACLDKFIGMFAFAILDNTKQKITIVRDRAGVKPLYYYQDESVFAFASELKSFHQLSSFEKKLNRSVLPYYFQFGYIAAPHTIFENVHKLLPGHYLQYDLTDSSFEITKYWDVADHYQKDKFNCGETRIITDLTELLTDAINLRMVADVPVGVFLSGGYDSSLVTALLAQDKTRKLHTFTIGFEDKRFNEAEHAKAIAQHFNTQHTELYVSNQAMLDKVESLPFYYDEPFADSSALPTMMVAELAKKDVTVALSADGGDEVFCGYSKYFMLKRFESIFNHPLKKALLRFGLRPFSPKTIETINSWLPKSKQPTNIQDKFIKFNRAMHSESLATMFYNASSYVATEDVNKFLKIKAGTFNQLEFDDNLSFMDNMLLTDYTTFMVDDVLTKVDRATMSNSLEGREPLLDHRIIEFMARVPLDIKYKNKQGKYLARQILYQHIPQTMVDKPKAGFQVPLVQWMLTDLKPLVDKHLEESQLDSEIFNVLEVLKIKQAFYAGEHTKVNTLWFILMFQMWREQWLV
ncbi:Asparagine synthetase [glutamine-hydrolyzing] [hydrothermal vent metagenome]|uniref:Asparagine synthetase [glutamine-hydrolyzing] n=1 Tax=hydrothermal vent metagenome TaxID=652676 RepID=A0A3B0W025_9ZZZZ